MHEISDQSTQLERIEETCKTISAHFEEAKTSHFWHRKFTDVDAINFEQSALIQDLQQQLLERNERIVDQWQENQALQELVLSYQSDMEQTAHVQADFEKLAREANDSKALQLEKDAIIKKQDEDLTALRQELAVRSGTLEAMKEKLSEAQQNQRQNTQMVRDKMEELTEKLGQAERQQTEQNATSKRKDEAITTLSNDLATKSGRLQAIEEQLRTARQEYEQHNQALHEQQAQNLMQAYNNTAEKFETERAEMSKQLKAANLANEQLQQELSGRARELQELENQVRDDGLEREEAQHHAAEKVKECQRLLDATTFRMGTFEAEQFNLQGQLQSARERNNKLDEDLSDARTTIEEFQARFEQATNATQSLAKERAKLQEQLDVAKAEVQRVQQALLEAEHVGGELRAQMDDAVTTEMTKTLKLANDALVAFQASQSSREIIQDRLGDFSGERLANAKWSEKVSRMRTDQDSATELEGYMKMISAVHERLQEMWKTHTENAAVVSQSAISTTISEMGGSAAQSSTNAATIILENADRERRVSIKSPVILEGVDIPLSVQQERTTRRGLSAPRSIMKMQSSENLIPETQVPKLKRARSIEIPDSQSQKKATNSRVNVRAPVAYTMYNRRDLCQRRPKTTPAKYHTKAQEHGFVSFGVATFLAVTSFRLWLS
ncbi:centrosomal protein CEP135 [Microdochium nivale]|nr:centrosomal protein CEP135 [Microdochium nivale]